MNSFKKTVLLLLLFSSTSLCAQEMHFRSASSEDMFMLREVGAVLRADGTTVKVEMAMPAESRPAAYKNVDIKTDDIVLFLNGKRIKALAEFTARYDSLKIGEMVELGLKRDEMRFIASFKKADPKDLPQPRMMTVRSDGGNVTTTDVSSDGRRMRMEPNEIEREMDDIQPVMELAAVVGGKGTIVKIARKLPLPVEGLDKDDLQEGDVLKSLNGEKIESLDWFIKAFGKIKIGEKVELVIERGGKANTLSFAKPEARGRMRIRRDSN